MTNRVFVKGDCHGSFDFLPYFCSYYNTTKNDVLIILGDAGINFATDYRTNVLKTFIASQPITLFCVHGNHEARPSTIDTYKIKYFEDYGCECWYEEEYPNILFPRDGMATINEKTYLILGGAYSIDKDFRLACGLPYFHDEQMDDSTKQYIRALVKGNNRFNYILSHTAPLNYEPIYLFLSGVDQSKVDKSMEKFLEEVYNLIEFGHWYFGHYHDDRQFNDEISIVYRKIIRID